MIRYLAVAAIVLIATSNGEAELPVFPGAVGFGTTTVAGSGRHLSPAKTQLFKVSSLGDKGEGTLRECVEHDGPRTCVFEISGRIALQRAIQIRNPYITIAGQTAPSPGIALANAGVEVYTHDVLVQHLEVRPGDDASGPPPGTRDSVSIRGNSFNVVIDHASVSWSIDENLSTGQDGVRDVTFSNCILAEALYKSRHPKGTHSMGLLVGDGSKRITIHDNLLAHNNERNPRLKPGATVEFVNNVVYNWGGTAWNTANVSDVEEVGEPILLRFAGNYYKPGPDSPHSEVLYGRDVNAGTRVSVAHNLGPTRSSEQEDEWRITSLPASHRSMVPPFPPSKVSVRLAEETLATVLRKAGSRPVERNSVDDRVVREVSQGTGSIKDCLTGCPRAAGGWAPMEMRKQVFLFVAPADGDQDGDGYTNMEEALHELSAKYEGN